MSAADTVRKAGSFGTLAGLLDRRNRLTMALVSAMSIGSALLELVSVACIYPLIRLIGNPGSNPPEWLQADLAKIIPAKQGELLMTAVLGFFALIAIKAVYNLVLLHLQERWFQRVSLETSARLIHHYMAAPWSEHLARNSSEMIGLADGAATWPLVSTLRSHVTQLTETLVLAGIVAILLYTAPLPTFLSIVVLALIFAPLAWINNRQLEELSEEGTRTVADRLRLIAQALAGLREIRILGRAGYFEQQYLDARARDGEVQRRFNIAINLPRLALEPVMVGIWALVTASIIIFNPDGMTELIALLGLFAVGALRLMPSLTRILSARATIKGNVAAIRNILIDLQLNQPARQMQGEGSFNAWKNVTFDRVSYAYPGTSRKALDDVSFSIMRGQSIGLVGPSGAGKSTVADILTGLLAGDSGTLAVDGAAMTGEFASWQQELGYVPQRVALLDASVRENIAYGVEPEHIDLDGMSAATAATGLDTVIASLPNGLDTIIGEHGARLSGGEQQRIGLARALYHGKSLLILDEATSALDRASEAAIIATIEQLRGKHSLLIIAHRTRVVEHCDEVLVLEQGRIADRGPFAQLTNRRSFEP